MLSSLALVSVIGYSSFLQINGNHEASASIGVSFVEISTSDNPVELSIEDASCDASGFVYCEHGLDYDGTYSYLGGKIVLTFSLATGSTVFSDIGYSSGKTMNISVKLTSTPDCLASIDYTDKMVVSSDSPITDENDRSTAADTETFTIPYKGSASATKVYCLVELSYNFGSLNTWTNSIYSELSSITSVSFSIEVSLGVSS